MVFSSLVVLGMVFSSLVVVALSPGRLMTFSSGALAMVFSSLVAAFSGAGLLISNAFFMRASISLSTSSFSTTGVMPCCLVTYSSMHFLSQKTSRSLTTVSFCSLLQLAQL